MRKALDQSGSELKISLVGLGQVGALAPALRLRLKHQFRHYDLPFIAAKAVLVFGLRVAWHIAHSTYVQSSSPVPMGLTARWI